MRISYRYEPDVCRFWIGATDGQNYQEYALQHWMEVEDVIIALRKAEELVLAKK